MVGVRFTTLGSAWVPAGAVPVEDGASASASMAADEPRSARINSA
jgi:hypothetical protein